MIDSGVHWGCDDVALLLELSAVVCCLVWSCVPWRVAAVVEYGRERERESDREIERMVCKHGV